MVGIIQGEDKSIAFTLNKTSGAYDLTGTTELAVKFPKIGGGAVEKKLTTAGVTITSAAQGKFEVALSDADTLQLRPENEQSIEIVIDVGAARRVFQIASILNVARKLFP